MAKGRVTNVWASRHNCPALRVTTSQIIIESLSPLTWLIADKSPTQITVEFPDCELGLPQGKISYYDGVVSGIEVKNGGRGAVAVMVSLDRPAELSVSQSKGFPHRYILALSHDAVSRIMSGRTIVVDPGHGGPDRGGRGPVNLIEKDVVLDIGYFLYKFLRQAGAVPVATRQEDRSISASERIRIARTHRAEAMVSIHTHSSPDEDINGAMTIYDPRIPESKELAGLVQQDLIRRLGIGDRGVRPGPVGAGAIPSCQVEVVAITNWVEEGMLRSPVFKERAAEGIFCGLVDFFSWSSSRPALAGIEKIPVRTHIISEKDNIVEVVRHYVKGIAGPGDLVCVAESVVAITQGRAVLPRDVRPSLLANFLCRFPGKDGSLATPPAMQLAIQEVGAPRVLLGSIAAGLGRIVGRKGDFYRVAGRSLALIDDIAGTMPPFDKHVILGPAHPEQVASRIRDATRAHALIADVNDKGCVDVLACTASIPIELLELVLGDNPFGNDDQQTPIVVVRGLLAGGDGPGSR